MKRSMTVLAVTVLMALALPARSQQPAENAKSPAASSLADSNRSTGERAVDPESNRADSERTSTTPLKAPPGWWDDFSTARQQARTLNKPLLAIFAAAEPYDDSWLPAATAPEIQAMIADQVVGTLNYEHEEPAAVKTFGVGKPKVPVVKPTTLVIAPDGAVLARYIGPLTAHILQILVDGATSGVPPVNAEMWLIRKTSPQGDEIAREVRSTFEKSGDNAEQLDALPETATKILFPPGVVREYSFQHAAEFKAWLKSRDLLAEILKFPSVCFDHYAGDFPLRREDQTIPIWTSILQDPLPNLWIARNPKLNLMCQWRLQAKPGLERLIFDRRSIQNEKISEGSPPTYQSSEKWVAVSLGRKDVSVFNAYGWPGDEVFRESAASQGYDVVVAVSRRREPLESAPEGKLVVPDGVRPIGPDVPDSLSIERLAALDMPGRSLSIELLDEARREAKRNARSVETTAPEKATENRFPRGRKAIVDLEIPTGWSSDGDAALDAAKVKKIPVIVVIDAPHYDAADRKKLEEQLGRDALGPDLSSQFAGLFFYISPFDELWQSLGAGPLPSMLAFDGDGKLLAKPAEGATTQQLKNLVAQVSERTTSQPSQADAADPNSNQQVTSQKPDAAGTPPAPAFWLSDFNVAKQAAKEQRLPLVVVMADPAQTPPAAGPLLDLSESKAVQKALNNEFVGLWHYSGPPDGLWQFHHVKKAPSLLIFDPDGTLLEGPIEDVTEERLLKAVASAVEKVVPMHAELWVVKSDLSGLADAAAVSQQLADAYAKAQVAPELVKHLPATTSQLLFPPEVTMEYSVADVLRLKAWLKSRQILEEVRPVTPFRFLATLASEMAGVEVRGTPIWWGAHDEPYSWTKLPGIRFNDTAPAFVERRLEWHWNFNGNPESGIYRLERKLNVNDHFRGQTEPTVARTLDFVDLNLPKVEAVIVNGFPLPTEWPLRDAMRRQGQEIVVVVSRAPIDDAAAVEATMLLPERVSPLAARHLEVYDWNAALNIRQAKTPSANTSEVPGIKIPDVPKGWFTDLPQVEIDARNRGGLILAVLLDPADRKAAEDWKSTWDSKAMSVLQAKGFSGIQFDGRPSGKWAAGIKSLPTAVVLDLNGQIVAGPSSDLTAASIQKLTDEAISKAAPYQAEIWRVKADWSQLPDAKAMTDEIRSVYADAQFPKATLDALPGTAIDILFPQSLSVHFQIDDARRFKNWLKNHGALLSDAAFSAAYPRGNSIAPRMIGGEMFPTWASTHLESYESFGLPQLPEADPNTPYLTRQISWEWQFITHPRGCYLDRRLIGEDVLRGKPTTQRLTFDTSQILVRPAKVTFLNAFQGEGDAGLRQAARAAGFEVMIAIWPITAFKSRDQGPGELTLPAQVNLLQVDHEAQYDWKALVASNSPEKSAQEKSAESGTSNNASDGSDHALQVARDVTGGPATLEDLIAEDEAKVRELLIKFGSNHPDLLAIQERLRARRSLQTTSLKIFPLKNSQAGELTRVLRQLFPVEPTEIVADERSNSLIVRATTETAAVIEAIVARLDSAPDASGKETRNTPFDREAKAEWLRNRILSVTGQKKLAENRDQAEFNRLSQIELQARYALKILSGDSAQADDHALQKALQIVEGLDRPKPELASVYEGREHRAGDLANRVKAGVPADEAERLKADVSQAVTEAFTARQSLLRAELAELKSRLQVLEHTIETRDKLQREIVKKRVDDLLNPDLKWDGDSSDDVRSKPVAGGQPGRGASSQSPPAEEQVIYVEGQNEEPGYWIRNPKPSEFADAALEPREVGVVQSPREATDIRISLARTDSVKLHEWLVVRSQPSGEGFGRARPQSIATIEVVDVQPDHAIAHVIGFNRVRTGNSYQNQSPAEGDTVHRPRNVAIQSDGDVRDSHFDPARLHDAFKTTQSPSRDQNRGGGFGGMGGRRSSRDAASYERKIAGVVSEVKRNDHVTVSLAYRDRVKPGDRLNVAETPDPSKPVASGSMMPMMAQRSAAAGMSLAQPVATIEVVSAQGDTAVCKIITINRVREENRYVDKLPESGDTVLFLTQAVRISSSGYGGGGPRPNDDLLLGGDSTGDLKTQLDPVNKPPVSHETIGVVSEAADAANITVSLARRNVIKIGDQLVAVDGSNGTQAMMPGMSPMGSMGGYGMGPRTPPPTELATLEVTKLDDGAAICRVKSFHRVREGNAYVDKLPKPGDAVLFVTGSPANAADGSPAAVEATSGIRLASADDLKRVTERGSRLDFEHMFRSGGEAGIVISAPDVDQVTVSLAEPAKAHSGEVMFVLSAELQKRGFGDPMTSAIQISTIDGNRAVCKVLKFRLVRYDGEYREIMPVKGDLLTQPARVIYAPEPATPPAGSRTPPESGAEQQIDTSEKVQKPDQKLGIIRHYIDPSRIIIELTSRKPKLYDHLLVKTQPETASSAMPADREIAILEIVNLTDDTVTCQILDVPDRRTHGVPRQPVPGDAVFEVPAPGDGEPAKHEQVGAVTRLLDERHITASLRHSAAVKIGDTLFVRNFPSTDAETAPRERKDSLPRYVNAVKITEIDGKTATCELPSPLHDSPKSNVRPPQIGDALMFISRPGNPAESKLSAMDQLDEDEVQPGDSNASPLASTAESTPPVESHTPPEQPAPAAVPETAPAY
jgi:hypothetical protein